MGRFSDEDEIDVCPSCGKLGTMYKQIILDSEDYDDGRANYSSEIHYEMNCRKCGYSEGSNGGLNG